MNVKLTLLVVLLLSLISHNVFADRFRVPSYFTCPRDSVTSWTGEVEEYKRKSGHIEFVIHTDADTTEHLTLSMPSELALEGQMYIKNKPFQHEQWPIIEGSEGLLNSPKKATIWLCLTGDIQPVVNWH